jgi:hypothetical protein
MEKMMQIKPKKVKNFKKEKEAPIKFPIYPEKSPGNLFLYSCFWAAELSLSRLVVEEGHKRILNMILKFFYFFFFLVARRIIFLPPTLFSPIHWKSTSQATPQKRKNEKFSWGFLPSSTIY